MAFFISLSLIRRAGELCHSDPLRLDSALSTVRAGMPPLKRTATIEIRIRRGNYRPYRYTIKSRRKNRNQELGTKNSGCRVFYKPSPLPSPLGKVPPKGADEVSSRCASRLCFNRRCPGDKDLIRLSTELQAIQSKSTFPKGEGSSVR